MAGDYTELNREVTCERCALSFDIADLGQVQVDSIEYV